MLEQLGNSGYQVGAVGVVAVTITYLLIVRWWTDVLGRVLAAVLGTVCLVLVTSTLRMLKFNSEGFFVWRAFAFWAFAIAVWAGLSTMVWAQFFAPRLKRRSSGDRLTTPRRRGHEEADLADPRPDRDGGSEHHPGVDG